MAQIRNGICALTGKPGRLVDAHILPRSFFKPASPDPFKEVSADGQRPKRIRTGWYDPNLLTRAGEDILQPYDNAAAKAFIQGGFTYSARREPDDVTRLKPGFVANHIYCIEGADVVRLRLFALSLLWRAAVTQLETFDRVTVSPSHLEDLRRRLVTADPGPHTDYPVYLGVFCSADERTKMSPFKPKGSRAFRFFLDGVICYVSPIRRMRPDTNLGALLLGANPERATLYCFDSLDSAHRNYEVALMERTQTTYGGIFAGAGRQSDGESDARTSGRKD